MLAAMKKLLNFHLFFSEKDSIFAHRKPYAESETILISPQG